MRCAVRCRCSSSTPCQRWTTAACSGEAVPSATARRIRAMPAAEMPSSRLVRPTALARALLTARRFASRRSERRTARLSHSRSPAATRAHAASLERLGARQRAETVTNGPAQREHVPADAMNGAPTVRHRTQTGREDVDTMAAVS